MKSSTFKKPTIEFDMNAGLVNPGDIVEYWTKDNGYYLNIAKERRVWPLPANTFKCYVNKELRVDLPYAEEE